MLPGGRFIQTWRFAMQSASREQSIDALDVRLDGQDYAMRGPVTAVHVMNDKVAVPLLP
ncbi:MAG: hypothetical protein K0S36_1623 [Nitrosospira multiformis]|jgi:hypothetical protein|nr:hypothetical protein [Nitrosospira multiformis]